MRLVDDSPLRNGPAPARPDRCQSRNGTVGRATERRSFASPPFTAWYDLAGAGISKCKVV